MNTTAFKTSVVRWGLFNGLVISICNLLALIFLAPKDILQSSGINSVIQSSILLLFGIYCYNMVIKDYKKESDESSVPMKTGAKLVFSKAILAGTIYFLSYYIYISFLDSSIVDLIKEQMTIQLAEQDLKDEELEAAMEMSSLMVNPLFISFSGTFVYKIFGALFLGLPIAYMNEKNDNATL